MDDMGALSFRQKPILQCVNSKEGLKMIHHLFLLGDKFEAPEVWACLSVISILMSWVASSWESLVIFFPLSYMIPGHSLQCCWLCLKREASLHVQTDQSSFWMQILSWQNWCRWRVETCFAEHLKRSCSFSSGFIASLIVYNFLNQGLGCQIPWSKLRQLET